MELIEFLVVGNIVFGLISFMLVIFLLAKIYLIEIVIKKFAKTEQKINKLLSANLPLVVNEQGQPVVPMPTDYKKPKERNPISG